MCPAKALRSIKLSFILSVLASLREIDGRYYKSFCDYFLRTNVLQLLVKNNTLQFVTAIPEPKFPSSSDAVNAR